MTAAAVTLTSNAARASMRRRRRVAWSTVALQSAVVAYVVVLIGGPLAALVVRAFAHGWHAAQLAMLARTTRDALWLTGWTSLVVALIDAVFGTLVAWVLVRYRFPGRGLLNALVDLPFAIPTLVAGMMLVFMLGPTRPLGSLLASRGVHVLFTPTAIVLVLLFVTLPFVVRAVEPVLEEIDPAEEEAARTLGASPLRAWRRVVLPAIAPAVVEGALQSYARALAEFGSIVVVAGNIPHRTMTASVLIYGEVESGRPERAAAISLVVLVAALIVSLIGRRMRRRAHG